MSPDMPEGSTTRPLPYPLPLPDLTRAARALAFLGGEGASIGAAVWFVRARERLPAYVASNALSPGARKFLIGDMLGCAVTAVLAGLAALTWRRPGGLDGAEGVSRRLAPLVLAGFVPLLFQWQLWYGGREATFIAMLGAFVLALQGLTRVALGAPPLLPRRWRAGVGGRPRRIVARLSAETWLAGAMVIVAALGYAVYFSVITIQNHFRMQTMGFDLGIENNLVWNAAHWNRPWFKTSVLGGPDSSHLGFHQTYISYLIGIPYRLAPRPETLLGLQAALIGGAALPFFAFARRHVGDWTACLVSVLLLLYPPLHGANLYDFHYLPFAPFFLWWSLWALESRRDVMATIAIVLTLANREDMSALLVFIGMYLVLTGERPRAGVIVTAVAAVYFVVVKLVWMPHVLNGYPAYINQYEGLLPEGDRGFGGVLKTMLGNPGFTLTNLLEHDKLIYLLEILAPLAFFPWRRPIGLLCSIPGFLFTMMSTHYPPLIEMSFQYTAYWTAFLFIAVIANLAWLGRLERAGAAWAANSRRAWLVAIVAGTIAASYQFGIVLQRNTAWGGFSPFRVGVTAADRAAHADLYALVARIPADASVAASESIVPHVSSRKNAYSLRIGYYDADYLLFRLPIGGDERTNLIAALRSRQYGLVGERGNFILARRGMAPETIADLMRRIGA
jgi:uncharacterized membrane protein